MAKIDLDIVKMVLSRNELDEPTANRIIQDLNHVIQEEEAAKEDKPPPVKKQFVILVSDPEGDLEDKDMTGWVVQIPEEDSPYTTEGRIHKASYEFNASPKGRRMPVHTIGEACEVVQAKFFKEEKIWVKTKEPILLVRTSNEIPTDEGGNQDDI